jgi:hypothetical protein
MGAGESSGPGGIPGRFFHGREEVKKQDRSPRRESAVLIDLPSLRRRLRRRGSAVTRSNVLYLVIGALAVAVAVLGYQLYKDRHQPQGVHIDVGPGGLSIQGK